MRQEGGAIGPLLEKHQPQRIFAIDMNGVRDAAGLAARTMDVFEAEFADFIEGILSPRHHDLPVPLASFSLLWRGITGGAKIDRLLRPAFQRGMSGIGQDVDAAL